MKSSISGIVLYVSGVGVALYGLPSITIMLKDGFGGLSVSTAIGLGLVALGILLSSIGLETISPRSSRK